MAYNRKAVSIVAICSTALYSIVGSAAFAATVGTATVDDPVAQGANGTTLSAMQAQCTALAASHGTAWTGTLDQGSIIASLINGPTEINPAARIKTNIEGTGTFTPAHTYIEGDPFRIGGSVNMFGDQYSDSGSWSDSEYDFTNSFASTFSFAFNCTMSESVYIAATGYHEWVNVPGRTEQDNQAACDAHDAAGQFIGVDVGHCVWRETTAAHYEDQDRPDEAGVAVSQDQTDTLSGHEYHGGPVQAPGGIYHIGQVVICISPNKPTPGGTWRTQNGYTGNLCTTDWFKVAPTNSGSTTSNGTYISVPNYTY
jgi:hypothetical protein